MSTEKKENKSLNRVIVNEELRGTRFLSSLRLDDLDIAFSTSVKPQLIFPGFPAVAVAILFVKDEPSFSAALDKLESIQRGFRHSYGILVCSNEIEYFDIQMQIRMACGMMRLLVTHDMESTAQMVQQIYEEMSSPKAIERMKGQVSL